jgi:hypothetical protein
MDDILSGISRFLVLLSLIPSGYFVIDYAIVRPLLRGTDEYGIRRPKFVPWWKSGIGVMFVMLGLSFFLTNVIITLSLWLGLDYPGREIVRVSGYSLCTASAVVMAVVYGLEGRNRESVLTAHGKES